jgi:hypothetical protein
VPKPPKRHANTLNNSVVGTSSFASVNKTRTMGIDATILYPSHHVSIQATQGPYIRFKSFFDPGYFPGKRKAEFALKSKLNEITS